MKSCFNRVSFLRYFPRSWRPHLWATALTHTRIHIQCNVTPLPIQCKRNEELYHRCACSAAGVNICVPITVINCNEIWDSSQHKAITMGLTKSINMICQCQEKNVTRKKRSWGPSGWQPTDLSQMCLFETTSEHGFHIWEEFCAITWPL